LIEHPRDVGIHFKARSKAMADRQVRKTRKDRDGDILALCADGAGWSPRDKEGAINDIEASLHTYFVLWPGGLRTEIRVVNGPSGKYLRTDRDDTSRNNLDDLPDC
jgi:hypothetical protein